MNEVDESTAPAEAARTGRSLLLTVLDELQRITAGPFAERALSHVARATSAFYAVETAPGLPSTADALRAGMTELSHALEALQEAPPGWPPGPRLTEHVARALAVVHSVVQPLSRRRREVLLPGAVPSLDRRALVALGDRLTEGQAQAGASPEHRRDTRVMVEVDVGLLSDSNFYTGLAEDVSNGGVFVSTRTPLPTGAMVLLFFVLPHGRTIKAEGVVRWHRLQATSATPGMGVAFTELGDEERLAIEAFCAERPALFHE